MSNYIPRPIAPGFIYKTIKKKIKYKSIIFTPKQKLRVYFPARMKAPGFIYKTIKKEIKYKTLFIFAPKQKFRAYFPARMKAPGFTLKNIYPQR